MSIRPAASLRLALVVAAVVAALVAARTVTASSSSTAVNMAGVVTVTTDLAFDGSSAAGTGMVLTRAGQVLTNNHVIKGATAIRVTIPSSGKSYSATVLGYSTGGDVALLQLKNASGLSTVATGDSSRVKIGQAVTAVGNAGGRGTTTSSTGKVTALNRSITVSDGGSNLTARLTNLIEIDAELEPGDSGGPLLDSLERVIGMNAAASLGFRFQASNDGYSIPINRALAVVKQVRSGRGSPTVHVGSTPLLGVSISSVAGDNTGAVVADIAPGLPADKAGIVAGSTITRLDGKPVGSYAQLTALLLRHHAGDTVTIRWMDPSGAFHAARIKTASGPPQ